MAYDRSMKVSQSTIDEIRKLGMAKAIEKANSGQSSAEFLEGASRFYGDRVKRPAVMDSAPGTTAPKTEAPKTQPISSTKPAPKPENVQAAAKRRVESPKVAASSKSGVTQVAEKLGEYKGPGLSKSEKEKNAEKYLKRGAAVMTPAEQRASRKKMEADKAGKKKPKKETTPEWKLRAEAREKGHTSYTEREKYIKEQREKGR